MQTFERLAGGDYEHVVFCRAERLARPDVPAIPDAAALEAAVMIAAGDIARAARQFAAE